jgi:hypothetical protein
MAAVVCCRNLITVPDETKFHKGKRPPKNNYMNFGWTSQSFIDNLFIVRMDNLHFKEKFGHLQGAAGAMRMVLLSISILFLALTHVINGCR